MTAEEIKHEKRKRNLLLELMRQRFENRVYEFLEEGNYRSIEELDAWLGDKMQRFYNEQAAVCTYYANKINS